MLSVSTDADLHADQVLACVSEKLKTPENRLKLANLDKTNLSALNNAFNKLCSTDLLTGVNAQANFDALVKAGAHAEILAEALWFYARRIKIC